MKFREIWIRVGKRIKKKALKRKYTGIERKITNRKKKLDSLPKKVRMFDRIEEEKIVRLADGKKLFFDWLKMCVWYIGKKKDCRDYKTLLYRSTRCE